MIILISAFLAAQAPAVPVQHNSADAAALFGALEGSWSCSGAFASGKKLESDLTFTRSLDGRALRYSHIDRAPNVYRQDSVWFGQRNGSTCVPRLDRLSA